MTLEAAFEALPQKLDALRTAIKYLEVFVEDRPHAHQYVDAMGEVVTDLWSRTDTAVTAAESAYGAVRLPADLERARRSLIECQAQYNVVQRRLVTELASDRQLTELLRLGQRLGGEWKGWAVNIRPVLNQCLPPLYEASQGLFLCWQELSDRTSTPQVSVHTVTVGQAYLPPAGV